MFLVLSLIFIVKLGQIGLNTNFLLFLKMIAKYLENTHALTHNQYHMELLDVFAVDHEKKSFTDVGNR